MWSLKSSRQRRALLFVFIDVRSVDLLERDHYFPSHPCVQWRALSCFYPSHHRKGMLHTSASRCYYTEQRLMQGGHALWMFFLWHGCIHLGDSVLPPLATGYWLRLMAVSLKTRAHIDPAQWLALPSTCASVCVWVHSLSLWGQCLCHGNKVTQNLHLFKDAFFSCVNYSVTKINTLDAHTSCSCGLTWLLLSCQYLTLSFDDALKHTHQFYPSHMSLSHEAAYLRSASLWAAKHRTFDFLLLRSWSTVVAY